MLVLAALFYQVSAIAESRPSLALVGGLAIGLGVWCWLRYQKRWPSPLLDATVLAQPVVAKPLLTSFLSFIAAYAFVLLAPIDLDLVVHLDSRLVGLVLMAGPVVALVANPVAGVLVDCLGQPLLMCLGRDITLAAQMGLLALSGIGEPWWLIGLSGFSVIGTALFTTAANTRIMTGVDPAHRVVVGAVNLLARELGMMLGVTAYLMAVLLLAVAMWVLLRRKN